MTFVSIRNLSFSFDQKPVLRDLTFDIEEGEFFGLMGPNGSGKTTLLRCLVNFLSAQEGSVEVDGRLLSSMSIVDIAKTFAVVPQSSATDFPFSAYDIVMMGRMPHMAGWFSGTGKADESVVRESMERTGTWQYATRPFSELSGGMRQRVIVARAIAQQPKALLLDEPTAYLDISGQIEIMDLVKHLNREHGISVIAVMHDINLASRYCDRISLLNEGVLEVIGKPSEVLTPEVIAGVYGIEVSVRKDPLTQAVYVLPRSPMAPMPRHGTRAHVLCGGGTGGPIVKALHEHGFSVTVGVVNVLDSDFESAKDMHVPVVTEAPFAPISHEKHAENLKMIQGASMVVVSPFPVGPGNLSNLEAARTALKQGKRVFVIRPEQGVSIDFVGGKADEAIKDLIGSGAVSIQSVEEILSEASRRAG
ncbi:MAG TPA: ABC transporter ATP-binding protein [Thermoplasmata archaeon]